MTTALPLQVSIPGNPIFFNGQTITLVLPVGFNVFVGPNGAGKTEVLKSTRDRLRQLGIFGNRKILYLSSGRSSPLEQFRSSPASPNSRNEEPAAIGQRHFMDNWWMIEGVTGVFLRLKQRPDLLLKVEARLQALYQRRLRLDWSQAGLQVEFSLTTGGRPYYANAEVSGLIQLIPLLAAMYDDGVGALLIDEPEISLHPQLQAFLLQEMELFAGEPTDPNKKLIIIATHSPIMLPVRRIRDISQLVFFTDRQNAPVQIGTNADVLKSTKLSALVARLSENHKLAFFARRVLLVEGPSDEIVVSGVALRLEHPLLGSNTQVGPVTGKGQFSETVKLFRLMGKDVFVLCDLDGFVDDNQLVNVFQQNAQSSANAAGMGSVTDIDRAIRDKLNTLLEQAFQALPLAASHRYWTAPRGQSPDDELKAKRRATLAALLSTSKNGLEELLDGELLALRTRSDALIGMLASAGCIILRRGTVEDYYLGQNSSNAVGKPETAAAQMELVSNLSIIGAREQFDDLVRAIEIAAPLRKIDENALLREQLASLIGAALQIAEPGMPDDELNSRAAANFSSTTPVFRFTNRSRKDGPLGSHKRIEVSITSPLFSRDGFPFEISEQDNLTPVIAQKLPTA